VNIQNSNNEFSQGSSSPKATPGNNEDDLNGSREEIECFEPMILNKKSSSPS